MRLNPFILCISFAAATLAHAEENWEQVKQEDGITVWQRPVPGTSNVEFRGRGMVEAPMVQLAAVVFGGDRGTDWMHHCAENYTLETKSPDSIIVYNRVASGAFLVSDRDMVVNTTLLLQPDKKIVRINLKDMNYPNKPAPGGVVRLASLKGFWEFEQKADGKVEATYQIMSDPAGSLPMWLVNQQARDLPLLTIKGLRKQVAKTGYEKRVAQLRKDFDFKPYE